MHTEPHRVDRNKPEAHSGWSYKEQRTTTLESVPQPCQCRGKCSIEVFQVTPSSPRESQASYSVMSSSVLCKVLCKHAFNSPFPPPTNPLHKSLVIDTQPSILFCAHRYMWCLLWMPSVLWKPSRQCLGISVNTPGTNWAPGWAPPSCQILGRLLPSWPNKTWPETRGQWGVPHYLWQSLFVLWVTSVSCF